MSKKVTVIKLGGGENSSNSRFDLSKLKQMREEQASTLLDTIEADESTSTPEDDVDPKALLEQMELDISHLPPPLTQDEIIYRRKLIMKGRRWIQTFPQYLKDFESEKIDTSRTIEELENVIQEMKFCVANRNSSRMATKAFETGLFIVENLHEDFRGLTTAFFADSDTNDLIKELCLENESLVYTKPEYRLMLLITLKIGEVRYSNKTKRLVDEVLEKPVDKSMIEEFNDL